MRKILHLVPALLILSGALLAACEVAEEGTPGAGTGTPVASSPTPGLNTAVTVTPQSTVFGTVSPGTPRPTGTVLATGTSVPSTTTPSSVGTPTGTGMPSPLGTPQWAEGNIATAIDDNDELTTFATILEKSGARSRLEQTGPYTLFAPDDQAFSKMEADDLTELRTNPVKAFDFVLGLLVERDITQAELIDGASFNTAGGSETLDVDVTDGKPAIGDAHIIGNPIQASNGTIYIIDRVIETDGAG